MLPSYFFNSHIWLNHVMDGLGTSQNWKQKEPCCPHTILRARWAGWWHQPFFQLVKFRQKFGITFFLNTKKK